MNDRTLAFGVLNLAYALGSFIGPRWAAHMLAAYGSWQLPLTIYGILGLLGAVLFILLVPRSFSEAQPEARDPNPGRRPTFRKASSTGTRACSPLPRWQGVWRPMAIWRSTRPICGPNCTFR